MTREKPSSDGAIPSGNSYAIANLQRLFELTSDIKYRKSAEAGLMAFGETLKRGPTTLSELLLAVDFHVAAVMQIVIVSPIGGDPSPFRRTVAEHFLPNHIYVETTEGVALDKLATSIPLLKSKIAIGGAVTAYVCQDSHCELPTGDIGVFKKQIGAANGPVSASP